MAAAAFKPGFRIDLTDTLVLIAGAAGAVFAARVEWWMGTLIAFAVGHFFLFCNVFRVGKPLELSWSALFVALAGCSIVLGQPGWGITLGATLLATVAVIVLQMRKASYHGIAWQRINPGLEQWWQAQGAGSPDAKP